MCWFRGCYHGRCTLFCVSSSEAAWRSHQGQGSLTLEGRRCPWIDQKGQGVGGCCLLTTHRALCQQPWHWPLTNDQMEWPNVHSTRILAGNKGQGPPLHQLPILELQSIHKLTGAGEAGNNTTGQVPVVDCSQVGHQTVKRYVLLCKSMLLSEFNHYQALGQIRELYQETVVNGMGTEVCCHNA